MKAYLRHNGLALFLFSVTIRPLILIPFVVIGLIGRAFEEAGNGIADRLPGLERPPR